MIFLQNFLFRLPLPVVCLYHPVDNSAYIKAKLTRDLHRAELVALLQVMDFVIGVVRNYGRQQQATVTGKRVLQKQSNRP